MRFRIFEGRTSLSRAATCSSHRAVAENSQVVRSSAFAALYTRLSIATGRANLAPASRTRDRYRWGRQRHGADRQQAISMTNATMDTTNVTSIAMRSAAEATSVARIRWIDGDGG